MRFDELIALEVDYDRDNKRRTYLCYKCNQACDVVRIEDIAEEEEWSRWPDLPPEEYVSECCEDYILEI